MDGGLKAIIADNLDKYRNPKIRNIYTLEKERFYWGEMNMLQNVNLFKKILWWKARNSEYHRWVTVKESSLVSNVEGKEVGYGIFAARLFQAGQTVTIYIGVSCGENKVNEYTITNNCEKNLMKLKVEISYPEVKELYIGAHIVNSPNYTDIKNRDRRKSNCYFLWEFTIVTLRGI